MGFLYKKLTDKEKEEIKNEAKGIIDSFARKIPKIKELPKESGVIREESVREEGIGKEGNREFKKRILDNAQNKNKDFIIAEKKGW